MQGTIRQVEADSGGSFFYVDDTGKDVGELHYRLTGKTVMTIDHTEVDPTMEGKGVGKHLVAYTAAYLRSRGLKVIPQCSYANATFERHPEWQDLLYNG